MAEAVWQTDCEACFGLCCIALAHRAEAGFPEAKPPLTPCQHLSNDFKCAVFGERAEAGYQICDAYDCYGAGPAITSLMKRSSPEQSDTLLNGFLELARLRMLITALERREEGGLHVLIMALDEAAGKAAETGNVHISPEVSALMRSHEAVISDILSKL